MKILDFVMNLNFLGFVMFTIPLLMGLVSFNYISTALKQTPKFIVQFRFSSALKNKISLKYPNLSHEQIELVFVGLRDYFEICYQANGEKVAMPSRVVDEAWHEFILYSQDYADYCYCAFGYFLHHTPADTDTNISERVNSLALTWQLSCKLKYVNPKKPSTLPLLFRMDEELAIPDGMKYALDFDAENYYRDVSGIGEVDLPSCSA